MIKNFIAFTILFLLLVGYIIITIYSFMKNMYSTSVNIRAPELRSKNMFFERHIQASNFRIFYHMLSEDLDSAVSDIIIKYT